MRILSAVLSTSILLSSCAVTPAPLPDEAHAQLGEAAPGRRVYHGAVAWSGDPSPSLSYERWVDTSGPSWTSTHVTLDPEPIITQRVRHSPSYTFERMDEVNAQLGTVSSVVLRPDGSLSFTQTHDERTRTRVEPPDTAPVVTGPTLFGHTLRHWDALERGATLELRFVVPEHTQTYRFTLAIEPTQDDDVTVIMRPVGFIEGLVVAPMRLVFDPRTRLIRRYEGAVPPRDRDLATRRARVDYTHDTARFD